MDLKSPCGLGAEGRGMGWGDGQGRERGCRYANWNGNTVQYKYCARNVYTVLKEPRRDKGSILSGASGKLS